MVNIIEELFGSTVIVALLHITLNIIKKSINTAIAEIIHRIAFCSEVDCSAFHINREYNARRSFAVFVGIITVCKRFDIVLGFALVVSIDNRNPAGFLNKSVKFRLKLCFFLRGEQFGIVTEFCLSCRKNKERSAENHNHCRKYCGKSFCHIHHKNNRPPNKPSAISAAAIIAAKARSFPAEVGSSP